MSENVMAAKALREEGTLAECEKLFEGGMCDGDGDLDLDLDLDGLSFGSDSSGSDLEYDSDGEEEEAVDPEDDEERRQRLRGQLIFLTHKFFESDPEYLRKTLSALNKEAAAFQKSGDDLSAIAAYAKLFSKVTRNRLTHPELYVTHCNR